MVYLNRDNPRWRLAIHEAAHGIASLATKTVYLAWKWTPTIKLGVVGIARLMLTPSRRLRPAIYLNNTKSGKGSRELRSPLIGSSAVWWFIWRDPGRRCV